MLGPPWLKKVYDLLKKIQPASLRATLTDGSTSELAISQHRRLKWQPVLAMLAKMAWVKLDFLNAKGQTLHTEEASGAGDVEDLHQGAAPSTFFREVRLQTSLMLEAQGAAMTMIKPVLDGYQTMLHDVFEMARSYRDEAVERGEQLELIASKMDKALAASSEGDDGGAMKQVAQVLQILQMVGLGPRFGAARAAGAAAGANGVKPNGAAK